MKTRVVVTGMGAITPIGNDVESFWQGLKDKTVGIGPITYFDTTDYKCKLAAEVKGFNARDYMDPKAARRMEAVHALASGREAVVVASARALVRALPPAGSNVHLPLVFEAGRELADMEGAKAAGIAEFGDVARALEERAPIPGGVGADVLHQQKTWAPWSPWTKGEPTNG